MAKRNAHQWSEMREGDILLGEQVSDEFRRLNPVGSQIGDYIVESLIARGGMGAVYRCIHKPTGEMCALKLLHRSMAEMEGVQERFYREMDILRMLHHPNVVKWLGRGESPRFGAYYAMEYLQGFTLTEAIDEGQSFSRERLRGFVQQMAHVLDYAHALGVVHRDLKPANIVLCPQLGKGEVVKVLDFGVAYWKKKKMIQKLTHEGDSMGTLSYMSPEQAHGNWSLVDHRTDIYAFGVMLYQILSGRLPIQADNPMQRLLKVAAGEITPLSRHLPLLHKHPIEHVLRQMMAPTPAERPSSIQEILSSLFFAIDSLPKAFFQHDAGGPGKSTIVGDLEAFSSPFGLTASPSRWFSRVNDFERVPVAQDYPVYAFSNEGQHTEETDGDIIIDCTDRTHTERPATIDEHGETHFQLEPVALWDTFVPIQWLALGSGHSSRTPTYVFLPISFWEALEQELSLRVGPTSQDLLHQMLVSFELTGESMNMKQMEELLESLSLYIREEGRQPFLHKAFCLLREHLS